jgi:hypothetical protein
VTLAVVVATGGAAFLVGAPARASTTDADPVTVCHEGSLPRERTEVDADIEVPGFDGALGTLLAVEVPVQSVHLDTDARFENTARGASTFEEHMTFEVAFTSPAALASPPPVSGTIERIPHQTIGGFDGALDFEGPSAVAQPPTARDAGAPPVSSSDPTVLAAFASPTVRFHVASSIGETFLGGGGNIEAKINTFAAATVRVCYRYAPPPPPTSPPTTSPPSPAPTAAPASPPTVRVARISVNEPVELAFTGRANGALAAGGLAVLGLGVGLVAWTRRRGAAPGRSFDLGGIDG